MADNLTLIESFKYEDCIDEFYPTNISGFGPIFKKYYSNIHRYDAPTIILLGLVSNILLLFVLSKRVMHSPCNLFLIGISIADILSILTYFFLWLPLVISGEYSFIYNYINALVSTPYSAYRFISVWMTVILGLWRVASVYSPFQNIIELNMKNAKIFLVLCFIFGNFIHVPHLYGKIDVFKCDRDDRISVYFYLVSISFFFYV